MHVSERMVEYCFDSNIYSGEEVKNKIEEIKKDFSKVSNKPVEVKLKLDDTGMYIVTFKFSEKTSKKQEKYYKRMNKFHIESLGEYSQEYLEKLTENKKKVKKQEKSRKPYIVNLKDTEEIKSETLKDKLNKFFNIFKNMNNPKLAKNNNAKINENKDYKVKNGNHYWNNNYTPKKYGKYKETKKFKPL